MLNSVMAARATLILILEEEVPVSDLRAPLPVIGRPCCRQILLYVFQMVETDDEAGEAPLIYRRPRCGYGSYRRKKYFNKMLPVFNYKSTIFSLWHSCFVSTTVYSAVSCCSTAAIHQPSANMLEHSLHFSLLSE